jgi:HK97 family phage major capsid protein
MIARLQEEYRAASGRAFAVRDKYQGDKGNMSADEEREFNAAIDEAEKLQGRIDTLLRAEKLEKWSAETAERSIAYQNAGGQGDSQGEKDALQMRAWKNFLTGGLRGMSDVEVRALQSDNPVGFGYLVGPQMFVQDLIVALKNQVFMRMLATVYTCDKAESLGVPTLDGDVDDADWTAELLTGNLDTGLATGRRELKPNPAAKQVKLSNKLIRQAAMDPVAIVRDRLAYKFGVTEEKGFLVGTGANQPLGVFTASTNGISTGRDINTTGTAALSGDDFINAFHNQRAPYWPKMQWLMSRGVVRGVRKLKDANNNYIWTLSGNGGATGPGNGLQASPGMILDRPYHVSEYAPSNVAVGTAFTSGQYAAIIGDFSYYWIADALDMQVQVLDQLFALTNQTGYIARKETDGMPVLEDAFTRLAFA